MCKSLRRGISMQKFSNISLNAFKPTKPWLKKILMNSTRKFRHAWLNTEMWPAYSQSSRLPTQVSRRLTKSNLDRQHRVRQLLYDPEVKLRKLSWWTWTSKSFRQITVRWSGWQTRSGMKQCSATIISGALRNATKLCDSTTSVNRWRVNCRTKCTRKRREIERIATLSALNTSSN